MKTVKAHLETLPEPYRSKALANTDTDILTSVAETVSQALWMAFVFSQTEEGTSYWLRISERIKKNEQLLDKLNTIDPKRYTSKQVVDELKRWAKDL